MGSLVRDGIIVEGLEFAVIILHGHSRSYSRDEAEGTFNLNIWSRSRHGPYRCGVELPEPMKLSGPS